MKDNGQKKIVQIPIPILGSLKAKMGASVAGLAVALDEDGTFEADVQRLPDGRMAPLAKRTDFMDATELLERIREIVREELAVVMKARQ